MSEVYKPELAFDLEGTLVDLERFHCEAFLHVAEQLGVNFGKKDFLAMVGAGDKAISEEISRIGKLSRYKLDPKEIRDAKVRVYSDMIDSHKIEAREGVLEYLERSLILVGGKLVIASLTPDEMADRILQESNLKPFFKYILTESSVMNKKPDPEVYQKAAERVGVSNSNMIVHEDSPTGVTVGKRAGSPVVAFPVHEGLKFEPQPDVIYLSWNKLTPDQVIDEIFKKTGRRSTTKTVTYK